ncbi:hypothetical protein AK812_SmicGene47015 [Symbiodinium microadriaticum]|uniref:Uncharacterized protein n=1 Tax=Symbiodinium microadriaticum TaxID=2951 RepID=A0A1Q9BSU7_SYMMI|nr:hypothetical protein AK812_SmicGene47015 [Symbiodinium microadriaticum]CAE7876009.1 unnamed protein product [Symbiodinium microadriaticum]
MSELPADFEEQPIVWSDEAVRVSESFQQEDSLQGAIAAVVKATKFKALCRRTIRSHEKAILELKQDNDDGSESSDEAVSDTEEARKLKSDNLETPPKNSAITMARLKSIVSEFKAGTEPKNNYTLPPAVLSSLRSIGDPKPFRPSMQYKNASMVDDDVDDVEREDADTGKNRKKQGPKKKLKGPKVSKKFRRVRKALRKAKKSKHQPENEKIAAEASTPTSKKRSGGANDMPGSYVPGKFREARLEFIRGQMEKCSLPWKEACKLWLPSAERAALLQGMSASERSKRRF